MKSGDAELAAMAEEEDTGLQARIQGLEEAVQKFILPPGSAGGSRSRDHGNPRRYRGGRGCDLRR